MTPWISYVTKVNRANKLMALAWTKVRHSLLVPGIESACLFTCTESVGLGAGRVPPWGEGCWAGTAESRGHFPYRLCRSEASGSVRIHFLAYTFLFFFSFSFSFFPFFPVFALAKTSNTTLNKSDASGNHCLVSDLREKAFSLFSVHTTPYDVGCRSLCICFPSCWGSYFCLKFVESFYREWMLSFTKCFSAFVS